MSLAGRNCIPAFGIFFLYVGIGMLLRIEMPELVIVGAVLFFGTSILLNQIEISQQIDKIQKPKRRRN